MTGKDDRTRFLKKKKLPLQKIGHIYPTLSLNDGISISKNFSKLSIGSGDHKRIKLPQFIVGERLFRTHMGYFLPNLGLKLCISGSYASL